MGWPAPLFRQRRLAVPVGGKGSANEYRDFRDRLGKNSCGVVGLDHAGTVVKRRHIRPESIPAFTQTMPACTVATEACCGAHHFGRLLRSQGHTVRLISPEYVRAYVKAQKNDDRNAEAIAEAGPSDYAVVELRQGMPRGH